MPTPVPPVETFDFLHVLRRYAEAFVERNPESRLALLAQALAPNAEIWGPSRVFAGYAEIDEKIVGFQRNWPDCSLVLAGGLITFRNTCHFPNAIAGPDGTVRAAGHSVVELAIDGRIQRVLAFWGTHPALPQSWPRKFAAQCRTDPAS